MGESPGRLTALARSRSLLTAARSLSRAELVWGVRSRRECGARCAGERFCRVCGLFAYAGRQPVCAINLLELVRLRSFCGEAEVSGGGVRWEFGASGIAVQ